MQAQRDVHMHVVIGGRHTCIMEQGHATNPLNEDAVGCPHQRESVAFRRAVLGHHVQRYLHDTLHHYGNMMTIEDNFLMMEVK